MPLFSTVIIIRYFFHVWVNKYGIICIEFVNKKQNTDQGEKRARCMGFIWLLFAGDTGEKIYFISFIFTIDFNIIYVILKKIKDKKKGGVKWR